MAAYPNGPIPDYLMPREVTPLPPSGFCCSFCFKVIRGRRDLCGGCKRRCYCSRECQKADWRPNGDGQGHKVWCDKKCGEEGVDWEVAYISAEKGKGIVALRDFHEHEILLVERLFTESEIEFPIYPNVTQEIGLLEPLGASISDIYRLNMVASNSDQGEEGGICVRMSRANHSCRANAYHHYVQKYNVKVLYIGAPVSKGEEILISYVDFLSPERTRVPASMVLQGKWGITCPPECRCQDEKFLELAREIQELDTQILNFGSMGQANAAYHAAETLLARLTTLQAGGPVFVTIWTRALYDLFQIGIMSRKNRKAGIEHLKKAATLKIVTHGLDDVETQKYIRYSENPSSHRNYMAIN
jgi:hypothetical protein